MQPYEYTIVRTELEASKQIAELNKFGALGWRVIRNWQVENGAAFLMERPKQTEMEGAA